MRIKAQDRIGTTVNGFFIVDVKRENKRTFALVICPYCHAKVWRRMDVISDERNLSCGCYNKNHNFKKTIDITGQRFGRLTAKKPTGEKDPYNGSIIWECVCDCGNTHYASLSSLNKGNVTSCGCLQQESRQKNGKKAADYIIDNFCKDGSNVKSIVSKTPSTNTSGIKGVHWDKSRNKWIAQIVFKGKHYHLGRYDNKEDAVQVRKKAEELLFDPFLQQFFTEYPDMWELVKGSEQFLSRENPFLSFLSTKELEIYKLISSGVTQAEVARILGCSRQNVNQYVSGINKKLAGRIGKKTSPRGRRCRINYSKYKDMDLSMLSDKQRRILLYKIGGKTIHEIAESEGMPACTVSAVLTSTIKVLDGKKKPLIDYTKYKDMDLSLLSDKQKRILLYKIEGKLNREIAELEKISVPNVSLVLKSAAKILEGHIPQKQRVDYLKYKDVDISSLPEKKQRLLRYKFEGKLNREIAELEGMTESGVGASLYNALEMLNKEKNIK